VKQNLDYLFHLPTLITVALFCIILVWWLYDVGLAAGNGYLLIKSSLGDLGIYWVHGCCYFDF